MAYTTLPNSAVCYILADIPGAGEFQATGVIIGPHTILTASHELWDASAGHGADQVSVYPAFVPNGSTYNPPGALGGTQAIHYITIADQNGLLSPKGTQHDFAVIDTSTDLSQYGQFALNYGFTTGDNVLIGYPASNNGNQTGTGAMLSADPLYSNLDTQALTISPGDSGGPVFDEVSNGRGGTVPAVTGIVSTQDYACKITRRKLGIIRAWVQSDSSLWTGQGAPAGAVVPQFAGTVGAPVNSATLAASLSSGSGSATGVANQSGGFGDFAAMVDVLHRTQSGAAETSLPIATTDPAAALSAPYHGPSLHQHPFGGMFSA